MKYEELMSLWLLGVCYGVVTFTVVLQIFPRWTQSFKLESTIWNFIWEWIISTQRFSQWVQVGNPLRMNEINSALWRPYFKVCDVYRCSVKFQEQNKKIQTLKNRIHVIWNFEGEKFPHADFGWVQVDPTFAADQQKASWFESELRASHIDGSFFHSLRPFLC